MFKKILTILAVLTLAAGLYACGGEEEGPAEKAGKQVDETMEETREEMDEMKEETMEMGEEAADRAEEAMDEVEDEMDH
jgi:F0F1-type ATP synthase membrane subunit b/b'